LYHIRFDKNPVHYLRYLDLVEATKSYDSIKVFSIEFSRTGLILISIDQGIFENH